MIAAQIVTGIGFIGAGTILHHRGSIRGLTTAASLWSAAAVGMAAGAGMLVMAAVGTVLIVIVLSLLEGVEGLLRRWLGHHRASDRSWTRATSPTTCRDPHPARRSPG